MINNLCIGIVVCCPWHVAIVLGYKSIRTQDIKMLQSFIYGDGSEHTSSISKTTDDQGDSDLGILIF